MSCRAASRRLKPWRMRSATDYAATSYAPQAQLAMARLYMDKNRDQDAADALSGIIASDADEEIKHVARARLARGLLYQNKAQEVVDLLEGQESDAFAPTYKELLGDAYHALGRIEDAQAAYQAVMLTRWPGAQLTSSSFSGKRSIFRKPRLAR